MMARKQITLGFMSGKMLRFDIKDDKVDEALKLFRYADPVVAKLFVNIKELMIQELVSFDSMYIRPSEIEMITVADPVPKAIVTPQKPSGGHILS